MEFIKSLGLKNLINDDISYFGSKYKALRDLTTAARATSRERNA